MRCRSSPQQRIPRTPQGSPQPHRSRDQNICLPCLDFLERANVQVRQFREFLLSHLPGHAFTPQVGAKRRELFRYGITGHALSCRRSLID